MMACKKALMEANGNEEEAIKILRQTGVAKAEAKSCRETAEGVVRFAKNAIVKLNCETDFVARNENFVALAEELAQEGAAKGLEAAEALFEQKKPDLVAKLGENITFGGVKILKEGSVFGGFIHFNNKIGALIALQGGTEEVARDIAMHTVASAPAFLSPADADATLLAKEREIWQGELAQSGKPAEIQAKIMEGKEKKFREERALLTQPFVKNPEQNIEQLAKSAGGAVVGFVRMEV